MLLLQRLLVLFLAIGLLMPLWAQEPVPSVEVPPTSGTAAPVEPFETPPSTALPSPPPQAPAPPPTASPVPPTPPPLETPEPVMPSIPSPSEIPPALPSAPGGPVRRIRLFFDKAAFSEELGIYQFWGNVTIESPPVTIHADEASYSTATDTILARGNVSITAENGITYWLNMLEFSVRTRQWRFIDYSVEYPAEFLGAPFIAPVFLGGRQVSGLTDRIQASDSRVTTCDLPSPHYFINASVVDIYPGDKLIARDIDFYVLNHRVLHLPWFFLSLKQKRSPIVPEFGENDTEGYYARFLYQYVLNSNNIGGIRWDQTQKLGTGIGVDHFYTIPGGTGEAFAYGRQGLNEYALHLTHAQQLPADITFNLRADARKRSLFTFQSTTDTNVNANLSRITKHSNSLFNYTRWLNKGQFSTDNNTANFRYNLNTSGGSFRLSEEFSSTRNTRGEEPSPANQELWNRVQLMRKLEFADLNLAVDQRIDLDGDNFTADSTFPGLQRLPEIVLRTDQTKLKWDLLQHLPSALTLGWGIYNQSPSLPSINRSLFRWESNVRSIPLGITTLSPTANFTQTVYDDSSDVTAQYAFNVGANALTRYGPLSNTFRYNLQETHGFTPLRIDTGYPSESISDSLQYKTENLLMNLTAGRDIEHQRWQDLTFRLVGRMSTKLTTSQALAYDLNTERWRDLVSQFQWYDSPRVIANLSSRYDIEGSRLRNVSTSVNWVIGPQWRLQWIGGYDGINQELLANEFLVTRDLHCWDVSLVSSYQRKYIFLYIRLKALNMPLPQFGIGRGGQVLDTSQGIPF